MRMSEAEKKAAALPPKLTVPMILFFLPVLFVVILGPAVIRVMATQETARRAGVKPKQRSGDAQVPVDGASGWPALALLEVFLLRQHLPQIGDIGGRLLGRQIGARDLLGLRKRPCRPTTSARFCRTVGSAGCGAARRSVVFGLRQILRQRVGQAEIGQHRGLVRHEPQRAGVVALGFGVAADLIEHGALHRQDAPVGPIRRVRAVEHLERLRVIAVVGERAAIGAEHGCCCGFWIVACSSTAAACARWPMARSAWA